MTTHSDLSASLTFTVTEDDTAIAVGSGTLPVLGTPRLLAWCEATTCAAIEPALTEGATSVGSRIALEHSGASRVGQLVEVSASASYVDGRLHRFTVAARHVEAGTDSSLAPTIGKVVGTGEITRVVVDSERFMARLG